MLFTVQDKREDPLHYVASFTTKPAAQKLISELEDQDRKDGVYVPDNYIIKRRGLCYSDLSRTCGNCTNCICMLDDPAKDCPKVLKRADAAADSGGE